MLFRSRSKSAKTSKEGQAPGYTGPVTTTGGKWLRRIVFVVVLAVVCLLLLAFAHIVAAWPWLSVVLGLPFAVYAVYVKE